MFVSSEAVCKNSRRLAEDHFLRRKSVLLRCVGELVKILIEIHHIEPEVAMKLFWHLDLSRNVYPQNFERLGFLRRFVSFFAVFFFGFRITAPPNPNT